MASLLQFNRSRHCGNCQSVITEQAVYKKKMCTKCHSGVPLSRNEWAEDGWGRCPNCFVFMHRAHLFCETCGWMNKVGHDIKRKRIQEARRLEMEAKQRRISALQQEVEELKAWKKRKLEAEKMEKSDGESVEVKKVSAQKEDQNEKENEPKTTEREVEPEKTDFELDPKKKNLDVGDEKPKDLSGDSVDVFDEDIDMSQFDEDILLST